MNQAITRDFTATVFVVHAESTLLLWHNKMQAWLPPGGHISPNELPDEAAVREVREETGLWVELLGNHSTLGAVTVLRRPERILLENISPGHQHVDLIYFATVCGPSQLTVNEREAARAGWYDAAGLSGDEVAEDIRVLGRQAIETVRAVLRGL